VQNPWEEVNLSKASAVREIYLEIGKKRVFAGAIHWPGWCRRGRDEASAIQALFDCSPRYAQVLGSTELGFVVPDDISLFHVVERLPGDATTDFGAPGALPSSDREPLAEDELDRFRAILAACWQAFDRAAARTGGRQLRKGPRGGGRDLPKMIDHVLEADAAYLSRLGWKMAKSPHLEPQDRLLRTRQAILEGLASAARGELPAKGPRGGLRWPPRYFVRRVAWHVLDHAWEIEDRLV
jgi:hypothetical protein